MAIENIIATIESLNDEGIKFASEKEYGKSIEVHQRAKDIAYENKEDLGIDYFLLSSANVAYSLRQADRIASSELILAGKFPVITSYFSNDRHKKTFFGTARVNEEMGVTKSYRGKQENDKAALDDAVSYLTAAVGLYNDALRNKDSEIRDEAAIKNRLFRTYGLLSVAFSDIKDHINAERYARLELDSRLETGESDTYNLMNAYHTLACAQTELAGNDIKMYDAAKENLETAKTMAEKHVKTVLELRSAWLEYVRNPSSEDRIEECLDRFFASNSHEGSGLSRTLVSYFSDNLRMIKESVSGKYQCMINHILR